MTKKTFRRAFRDSLPILAGYLALGFGFGVLLQSKGYSFWWAILMACTMFAGSGQYAGVDFLASGATILTTALMTLIINARHFFYGFSLLDNAMTALFIVIMVEQWLSAKEHLPAILGAATTAVCLAVFGPDLFIIPAMTFIALELVLLRKRLDRTEENGEADADD